MLTALPFAEVTTEACVERFEHSLIVAEVRRARTWRYAWTAINGASAIGGFAVAPFVDTETRKDLVVGSVAAAVSTVVTLAWPLEVEELAGVERPLDCAGHRRLEVRVASAARDEVSRVSWPWHVANGAVSVALGLVLAIGFHHPRSAWFAGIGTFVSGELQLITQPTGLDFAVRW